MSFIQLQDVGVVFPIYGASSRSLKQHVIHLGTGGRIGAPEGRVAVEALANITLEFKHGDRVGLVGHNGAGKTTLLRVLGGIYEPTQGAIKVQGRVAPVFDIGLGMDPDSTGYENIRLRGLYLGMTRSEIARRMDEIAAFTELGPFLDMPVRTYSAGMQARLAFSVSTSIEPDILLLDEGVGAGDAKFALRAQARVRDLISRSGILVFASHSSGLLKSLCNKAILMERGRVIAQGDIDDVLAQHQAMSTPVPETAE
ncbi:MAG TPA: ABC transporter ATP-binding protein [Microvirga sp.]|jgi:ABC-2 type transport system ATP-binding protein/lipopolysaccharide transport system ATP-binding protein|nr:ABC transporter ATP-binding protein [Microvirga sp.]